MQNLFRQSCTVVAFSHQASDAIGIFWATFFVAGIRTCDSHGGQPGVDVVFGLVQILYFLQSGQQGAEGRRYGNNAQPTLHHTSLNHTTLRPALRTNNVQCTRHHTSLNHTLHPAHPTNNAQSTLQHTSLNHTTLHYTTLHYTTLHPARPANVRSTIHHTSLHHTTLHPAHPANAQSALQYAVM